MKTKGRYISKVDVNSWIRGGKWDWSVGGKLDQKEKRGIRISQKLNSSTNSSFTPKNLALFREVKGTNPSH